MAWEDDIHMGESLRGMQDASVGSYSEIGAARALRGALGQLAQSRFAGHAPTSKQMRSPYKDSTQLGISCNGTFVASNWGGSALPQVTGVTRAYKSFKPTKMIITELLVYTWQNSTGPVMTSATVSDASDLILVSAFSGADNCFPNAPNESNGLSGAAFANVALGNGISWPTINGGIDVTVGLAVEQTALYRATPPDPSYTLQSVVVRARVNLLGPSLR